MRNNVPYSFSRVLLTAVIVTLAACGGGGGSSTGTESAPVATDNTVAGTDIGFVGNAVKSAVNNAEVVLVYFDEDGREVEIRASNAPVKTGVNGRFVFQAPLYDLPPNLGPGILRIEGGTTGADRGLAPRLETVIPDISAISNSSNLLSHMTAASSVAAALLSTEARTIGARPAVEVAQEILDRVEAQLLVDLSQDPTLATTAVAQFNADIDALLSLEESSINNSSVNELVSYLAANLSSSSLALDDTMQNPTNPGFDVAASLRVFGSGALSTLFPAGPEQLLYMRIERDRARIANDGFEVATLAVSIRNLLGATIPPSGAEAVEFTIVEGQGSLTVANLTADGDQVTVGLSSIAAGVVLVEASYTMPSGLHLTQVVEVEVLDEVVDSVGPTIISALSISNTEVIVTFSEALRGGITGAENALFYTITATDGTGQSIISSSVVGVLSATLIAPDNSSVRLVTQSQSDIDYILQTTNLRDLAGNTFLPPDNGFGAVNPSATIFVGKGPSGSDIVDSDGDQLSDSDELRGWTVTITSATGEITSYSVTSDPENPDTDGDGVTDNEEKHGALDPRTADTDGDTLTDDAEWNTIFSDGTNQDSDGDGVQDGFEYITYRTSPILADTDGDQISDFDEVAAGNRNPLVADLPSPRVRVGSINLALDTRFTYETENKVTELEQKTSEITLTSAEDETFATSNEETTKELLETSQELSLTVSKGAGGNGATPSPFPSVSGTATAGSKQGSEQGSTFSTSEETGRSSEEAYHDSLTSSLERTRTETVTREVVGASMKVSVTIDSAGDIPFGISNLELSAETQNPSKRSEMIPIASLTPENTFLETVNIGTLGDNARGPFVFEAKEVFPQQVEELMKNPRGLLISLANFDITDESGRNFSFISQEVLDRTVGITFDMGDGRSESYRVATASAHNRATGRPLGISMSYALSAIGLQRYPYIVDGGNGILESVPSEQDDSVAEAGSMVEPGQVVVTAGSNGILDTSPGGDDRWMEPDYESFLQDAFAEIVDGGNGTVDTEAAASDAQEVAHETSLGDFTNRVDPRAILVTEGGDGDLATEPNHLEAGLPVGDDRRVVTPARKLLKRFRELEANGGESRFWVMFTPYDRPGVDMDNLFLRAGEQYNFAYVQDRDGDEVFARVEYLHGSSDRSTNSDGCNASNSSDPTTSAYWERSDDCDFLDDYQEITDGWRVNLRDTLKDYLVYPNPVQGDSDRDGLFDDQEKLCGLDPRQRDTDLDGLSDWEELTGRLRELGSGGAANDNMVSRLPRDLSVVRSVPVYDAQEYVDDNGTPETDDDTILASHDSFDFCYSLHSDPGGSTFTLSRGFATDPLKFDTDGDQIGDGLELRLGLDPNDRRDGASFLDDDGDGIPNSKELEEYDAWVNGELVQFTSSPVNSDSDDDGLPDLLERLLGSNPSLPDGADTDGDGISDFNEYKDGGFACVTVGGGTEPCVPFNETSGWQDFLVGCQAAEECNPADVTAILASRQSLQRGTNLSHEDSDGDGLLDPDEINGWTIAVNGLFNIPVDSNPLLADADGDGWTDSQEFDAMTDPRKFDTDGDGETVGDRAEESRGRDPTNRDKRISVAHQQQLVYGDTGDGEAAYYFYVNGVRSGCEVKDKDFEGNTSPAFSCPGNLIAGAIVRENPPAGNQTIVLYASEVDDGFDGYETITGGNDSYCNTKTLTFSYESETEVVSHTFDGQCATEGDLKLTVKFNVTVD